MINPKDYNCRERGECYLTYRRRIQREHEQYLQDRVNNQTNEEWIRGYTEHQKKGMGIFLEVRARMDEIAKRKV